MAKMTCLFECMDYSNKTTLTLHRFVIESSLKFLLLILIAIYSGYPGELSGSTYSFQWQWLSKTKSAIFEPMNHR